MMTMPGASPPHTGDVFYTPAQGRDYRASQGSRWTSLGLTVAIYAMAAGLMLVTFPPHAPQPAAPAGLTVMDAQSPPASPPETPQKPRNTPRPLERHEAVRQPVATEPLPPIKVSISPVMAPPPAIAPRVADPLPRETEDAAPATAPAPPAPRLASKGPDTWEGRVLAQLGKVRHYPALAMARREQGVPYIRFVMNRHGQVLSVRLERGSGFPDLDREALSLPRRAQPLPVPPEDRTGETIELVVPVEFLIHG